MAQTKGILLILVLLLSAKCIAKPSNNFHIHDGSTKDSAIKFVEKYDGHLKRGISLNNLNMYWSALKRQEFNRVARVISKVSGNRIFVELQRMIDIEHTNSLCQEVDLVDVKTTYRIHRKAKLTYSVKNRCKDWVRPMKRVVAMKYLHKEDRWVIDSIINLEQ